MVVLVRHGLETLVPGIDFAALKDIGYRQFVRGVLEANPTRTITLPEMQLIWDAVVYKIYRFECGCAKEAKVNEVLIWIFSVQTTYQWLTTGRAWELTATFRLTTISLSQTSGVAYPPQGLHFFVTLPMPRHKRPRKTKVSNSDSEDDEDDFRAAEVFDSSSKFDARILIGANRATRQKRRGGNEDPRDNIAPVPEIASQFQASFNTICFHAITTFNA